jgi:hypothetical protein
MTLSANTVTTSTSLPDPLLRPTLSVEEAGALFGLKRTKAYEEARRYLRSGGESGIPTLAFGRSLRCPTAQVLALLGLPIIGTDGVAA